ncbi:unnamed protein product [Symbiodinium pilosum]|uniref:inorganic diphosphatase n=1 Tax=Symbiodinium pilosum TaxID=2952 RepID=A0A812KX06_SYMPI|nr:unnamed protein product [Symbiodinium pilosum]
MEVFHEYVAVAKVYAFPIAGMLLVLYPAALMAWTVIEGNNSKKERDDSQEQLGKSKELDFQKPQKVIKRTMWEGVNWTHTAKCFKLRRSSSLATGLAVVAALLAARQLISSCFVSVPVMKTALPHLGQEGQAPPVTEAWNFIDYKPVVAAFSAAAAAGVALKRLSFPRPCHAWALGRRGGATQRRATFAKSADVSQPGLFDRQLSGPWTAAEAPAAHEDTNSPADAPPSLWHDVDLYVKSWLDEPTAMLRYVNEMPMGTLRKFEVQPDAPNNAIEEDMKGSKKLAAFGKPVPFNYGCFPQTYRDPEKADDLYQAPGDDDPLDVIDLADTPTEVGTIVRCRVLGAVCLIDEGQADWKVLVVNVDSKSALANAYTVEDVERISPGRIQACWTWMDELKRGGGKGNATLHREIHDANRALKLIAQGAGSMGTLDPGACKLFVGGISAQTSTHALHSHFAKYGHVIDAVVMSRDGKARGFGFVTFSSVVAAVNALSEPQWLDGRLVDVKRAVPGERVQERSSNKVFIGGLPQDVTTEALREYFGAYGPVADAVVMVDRRTRRSRGFGFVRFANGPQGAQAAQAVLMDFADHWLGGKWVEVKPATPAAMLQEMANCLERSSSAQLDADLRHCLDTGNPWDARGYEGKAAWSNKGQSLARRGRQAPGRQAPLPTLLGSTTGSRAAAAKQQAAQPCWPPAAGHFPGDPRAMQGLLSSPMKVACGGGYFVPGVAEDGFGLPTYMPPEV